MPEEKVRYSYHDYRGWDESVRVELIDGVVYNMSPAPNRRHQEILRELSAEFIQFLRDKTCEVYFAPFDVRLFAKASKIMTCLAKLFHFVVSASELDCSIQLFL